MINTHIPELTIDPEFQSLIPPLSPEEYEGLKDSIRTHGFRPERGLILTWQGVIIDGHNRYQICRELADEGLEVRLDPETHIREMEHLPDRAAVILWMLRNQLGRRNLSDAARIDIALKVEALLRVEAKERQATSTGGSNPQLLQHLAKAAKKPINTRKTVAGLAGKSEETVRRVKKIKAHGDPELLDAVMSGKKSIHAGYQEVKARELADGEGADNEALTHEAGTAGWSGRTSRQEAGTAAPDGETAQAAIITAYAPGSSGQAETLRAYLDGMAALLGEIKAGSVPAAEHEKMKGLAESVQALLAEFSEVFK